MRRQPPAREARHPVRADSDKPDASSAYAQAVGRLSGSGAEHEAEKAQTKDGAGGGADMRVGTRRASAQDRGVTDSDVST